MHKKETLETRSKFFMNFHEGSSHVVNSQTDLSE